LKLTPQRLAHAEAVLAELLRFARPADQTLSLHFRRNRELGQQDRAFIAEAVFAVLRRKRSLEAAAGSPAPRALLVASLVRIFGLSGRALEADMELVSRIKGLSKEKLTDAEQADLPDWLWERLVTERGATEAAAIAQGLLQQAPLDLRVNLAKIERARALAGLGLEAAVTRYSPAGLRLAGKPAINRNPLFERGAIEVQDEGSQLLAYLLAPRRGEMVADFCAGSGGKTLALSMLMRDSGRVYAMDISKARLADLAPRAARAGISNVHPIVLAGENDQRAKRLAGKLDRVLVDAPCSGFGTLRRNPDLKWRHGARAVSELAAKQSRILAAAAKLVKPGGRLVYATCSILAEENEDVVEGFLAASPAFRQVPVSDILKQQKIALEQGARFQLWPHRHGTDGFFAAAFERAR
jgi:16S rRNA (cytosine967-C5)-methyltransferase